MEFTLLRVFLLEYVKNKYTENSEAKTLLRKEILQYIKEMSNSELVGFASTIVTEELSNSM